MLQKGDLIFLASKEESPISSLEKSIKCQQGIEYFIHHVGIYIENGQIIESRMPKGVIISDLNYFKRNNYGIIARIKKDYIIDQEKIIEIAKRYVGFNYNSNHIKNETSLNCSDLIYQIYEDYHRDIFFTPTKLNFRNYRNKKIDDSWKNEVNKTNLPGTHPAKLLRDEKISIIKLFK